MTTSGIIVYTAKVPPADYNQALRSYFVFQQWVLMNGFCYRANVDGIIHAPAHPKSPAGQTEFSHTLLDDPDWTVNVDFVCATAAAAQDLEGRRLPCNASLQKL